MAIMTSLERVETVLRGGIPDQVPVGMHNFIMTAYASGLSYPEYFQNGELMAEGQLKAWREMAQPPWRRPVDAKWNTCETAHLFASGRPYTASMKSTNS